MRAGWPEAPAPPCCLLWCQGWEKFSTGLLKTPGFLPAFETLVCGFLRPDWVTVW